jgi:hypothetical protein
MERIVEWEEKAYSNYAGVLTNFVLFVRSTGCIACDMRYIPLIYINKYTSVDALVMFLPKKK